MGYELIEHTIPEQLQIASEKYKENLAYIFPDEEKKMTFGDMKIKADRVAKALLALGLRHGDHIGIWSINCSAWVELLYGAATIGVITVPLNTCYQYQELDDLCLRGEVQTLFVMSECKGKSCQPITDQFFEKGQIKEKYTRLKQVVSLGKYAEFPYISWEDFLEGAKKVSDEILQQEAAKVKKEDDYLIQYTSGTTSKPKGAILYQRGVLNTAKAYGTLLHMEEEDCTCVPLPLFHCFGNILTLLGGLISGSTTMYLGYFSPKRMLSLMEQEKCTCMMGVPTMYFSMLETPEFHKYGLSHLTKAGIGGALCPKELCKRISDGFGISGLIIGYGLSEAASLCTLSDISDPEEIRLGSVGRALPGLEVSLADGNGKESREVTEGEFLIRGYGVMKGYYRDPDHTRNALDSNGWLHSGDLGRRNADGTFQVIGRVKDIIIKGGENISPGDIEEKLLTMEGVAQCQCVGVEDSKYGEVVCACIISKDRRQIGLEEVRGFLKSRIACYKIPDHVLMMEEFPVNGAGKVLKNKLTEQANQVFSGK